jgi:hypothetical protein
MAEESEATKIIEVFGIPIPIKVTSSPITTPAIKARAEVTPNFRVHGGIDSIAGFFGGADYRKGPFRVSGRAEKNQALARAALGIGNFAEIHGGYTKGKNSTEHTYGGSLRIPDTPVSVAIDRSESKTPFGKQEVTKTQGVYRTPSGELNVYLNKDLYNKAKGVKGTINLPENWRVSGLMQRTDPFYGGHYYNAEGQLTKTFENNAIATLVATHGPIESAKILLGITTPLN